MREDKIIKAQVEAAYVALHAAQLVGDIAQVDGGAGDFIWRQSALRGVAVIREALDRIEAATTAQVVAFPVGGPRPGPEAA